MHRQIGILLKKLASGVARSIQKGLCVTGLMLVPVVCSALPVQVFWMVVCQAPLVMSEKVSVHGGLKAYLKDM